MWRSESQNLMDHAEYITTGSSLRLPEIQQLKGLRKFDAERYSVAESGEAMWIRIPSNILKQDYSIFSAQPYIRNFDIYFPIFTGRLTQYQNTEVLSTGKVRGRSIHAFAHMPNSIDAEQPIYIRIEGPVQNPDFQTMLYEDFSVYENRLSLFFSIHFTVFIIIFLVNVILYYIFKEKSYLFHGLFQLFTTLSLYYFTSFGNRMYDMGRTFHYEEYQILALLFMYLFLYDYLKVKSKGILFRELYLGAMAIVGTSAFFILMTNHDQEMYFTAAITSLSYLFIFAATYYTYRNKTRFSVWIPFATYVLMLSSVLHTLSLYAFLGSSISIRLMVFTSVLIEAVVFTYSIFHHISDQQKENAFLKNQVNLDHLTGLKNRYYLDKYAKEKMMLLEKGGKSTSMIILDIDFFKSVNDDFGHDKGDEVLQELARKLEATFRKEDSVTRLGGEEFIILLYDSNLKTAELLAERARSVVEHTDFGLQRPLTISLGVAEKKPGETFNELYKRADDALYTAKSMGRNQVRLSREHTFTAFLDVQQEPE
ncbi:sensor domain-containing diguanylate cyclase [Proteiniclasticum ruminis]|uniref:Diguanylate cyclase (GGDEF) domain-containing protein n=1 Tax=Proteiniclasticum ruminis TaxID=398199 RepID=A0A1I5BDM2_9CLOT|nr:diguanylate cyclase [Proteiniclasticum ruminis]SFN72802.1 diguanylate cyclase (GGDEF) domain-containing protein [Proteiniclasticum ruminis]